MYLDSSKDSYHMPYFSLRGVENNNEVNVSELYIWWKLIYVMIYLVSLINILVASNAQKKHANKETKTKINKKQKQKQNKKQNKKKKKKTPNTKRNNQIKTTSNVNDIGAFLTIETLFQTSSDLVTDTYLDNLSQ